MAFFSGWQGLLAVDEATEWFWFVSVMDSSRVVTLMSYLSNKVEGNHISGLSGDRVGRELELVVRRNGDHHSGSGSGHGLGKPGSENSGEKHLVRCSGEG